MNQDKQIKENKKIEEHFGVDTNEAIEKLDEKK